MTPEVLFQIWDRFDKSDVSEIVFETAEGKIELKKNISAPINTSYIAPPVVAPVSGAEPVAVVKEDNQAEETHGDTILKAPLVGTFYRSPAPGEAPFVQIGQKVKKGDVIGIIEAMKLMNEITAPCDGTITNIFIQDETLVEFDQKILSIGE